VALRLLAGVVWMYLVVMSVPLCGDERMSDQRAGCRCGDHPAYFDQRLIIL
jgi:hypothetical protein